MPRRTFLRHGSRGYGRKSHSIDGMPGPWRAFMAERHPEILKDVIGVIEG